MALIGGALADRLIRVGHDVLLVRKSFTIAGFAIASTVVAGAYASSLRWALFWNVASLSGLGLATANHLALCRLTLIPQEIAGRVAGIQQVATALAGIVAPVLTGWLLQIGGDYRLPIDAILLFLLIGAITTAFGIRREWSLRLTHDRTRTTLA